MPTNTARLRSLAQRRGEPTLTPQRNLAARRGRCCTLSRDCSGHWRNPDRQRDGTTSSPRHNPAAHHRRGHTYSQDRSAQWRSPDRQPCETTPLPWLGPAARPDRWRRSPQAGSELWPNLALPMEKEAVAQLRNRLCHMQRYHLQTALPELTQQGSLSERWP